MRVLYVNPLARLGGSERSLVDLMLSLRAARPDIESRLLLFEDGELAELVRSQGFNVAIERLPKALRELGEARRADARSGKLELVRGVWAAPRFIAAVRGVLRASCPDIVHTNGMKAHLVAAALRARPLVVHLRDFVSQRRVSRRVFSALPRGTLVVTNSRAVADDLGVVAPRLAREVVYNAVDIEAFRPGPTEPNHLAALAGMPAPDVGTLTVGLVATYAWWKGHFDFIEAALRVRRALPGMPLRFYVVGGSIYATRDSDITRGELEAAVRGHGLEGMLGIVPFQSDASSIYRGLDVVVHASTRAEPFGRTIAEAMASGKAVIVARAGGAAELFEEGRSALGFTPGDPDDLARAIVRVVSDDSLRAALGAEGRRTAVQRFDRTRLGPQVAEVYERLVASSNALRR
jgi:glycosyltransferase involved in cell wall biosynthesis